LHQIINITENIITTPAAIIEQYEQDQRLKNLATALNSGSSHRIHLKGIIGSLDAIIALAMFKLQHQSHLLMFPDREEATYFLNDLENLSDREHLFFPASYRKAFDPSAVDSNNVLQRAEVLTKLKNQKGRPFIVVSYPEAIAERVLNEETLSKNILDISHGDKLSVDFISDFLTEYHFERTDFVYLPGQFSVRGGIVDIFSYSNELPYRVEFFGDHIESIREFEIESQLSVKKIKTITIVPNVQSSNLMLSNVSMLNYLDNDLTIWFKDVQMTFDVLKKGTENASNWFSQLSIEDKKMHPEWYDPAGIFDSDKTFSHLISTKKIIEWGKQFFFESTQSFHFDIRPQPSFNKDFTLLIHTLKKNEAENINNLIFADTAKQAERLYSIFEDLDKTVHFTPIHISIREGFVDLTQNLACYTDHQIFDRFYKYRLKSGYTRSQSMTLKELRTLKPGDFVTHIDHGVGKYAGLEKIEINGKTQETIRLVYADNDLLYVSINQLNRIAKFTGKEGTEPKMNKLGTDTWDKLKKSTKKKVKDIARDLIKLYAKRKTRKGNAFLPDTYLQTELEASFIYEDTPDQLKATADVKKDMEAAHPMDRLVCGDVGFGKTEVAIRAAFKAVADSKQVAILVPTTILALQHYKTFKERLKDFPANVDYVNRFKTAKQIKETLQNTADGKVDILIGTHRIVSKDVKFKDLGLLIIDEEQKFGVGTKEKLKEMRVNVDTLTLTATPIPRTLHFSLMGARDLSIINTPPPNRQPVTTELHVFNEKLIKEAIDFERDRGGQAFFVNNRISDIHVIAGLISKLCPGVKVGVGHGQMPGDELEDVMMKFVSGEYDVLVATTIIESGLDISNANTIIINHAHMFGLSDLHQMRGRVGRSNKKAFCYLLSPPLSTVTPEARKRLSAIEEFSDLGSGFNVAMRDLDIRGSGNMLGAEQSGFIADIGFDMYHKILDEAIQELKEDEFHELFIDEAPRPFVGFSQIETDLEILIPDEYVSSVAERLSLYSEMNKMETETQLSAFGNELHDRFGELPRQVIELLDTVRLQWLCKSLGFERVILKNGIFKGFLVANPASLYYESLGFTQILKYVQTHPKNTRLKEIKNSLTLTFDQVKSVKAAIGILSEIQLETKS